LSLILRQPGEAAQGQSRRVTEKDLALVEPASPAPPPVPAAAPPPARPGAAKVTIIRDLKREEYSVTRQ
jgi:hypothetical protein